MEENKSELIKDFIFEQDKFFDAVKNGSATKKQEDKWAEDCLDLMKRMGLVK